MTRTSRGMFFEILAVAVVVVVGLLAPRGVKAAPFGGFFQQGAKQLEQGAKQLEKDANKVAGDVGNFFNQFGHKEAPKSGGGGPGIGGGLNFGGSGIGGGLNAGGGPGIGGGLNVGGLGIGGGIDFGGDHGARGGVDEDGGGVDEDGGGVDKDGGGVDEDGGHVPSESPPGEVLPRVTTTPADEDSTAAAAVEPTVASWIDVPVATDTSTSVEDDTTDSAVVEDAGASPIGVSGTITSTDMSVGEIDPGVSADIMTSTDIFPDEIDPIVSGIMTSTDVAIEEEEDAQGVTETITSTDMSIGGIDPVVSGIMASTDMSTDVSEIMSTSTDASSVVGGVADGSIAGGESGEEMVSSTDASSVVGGVADGSITGGESGGVTGSTETSAGEVVGPPTSTGAETTSGFVATSVTIGSPTDSYEVEFKEDRNGTDVAESSTSVGDDVDEEQLGTTPLYWGVGYQPLTVAVTTVATLYGGLTTTEDGDAFEVASFNPATTKEHRGKDKGGGGYVGPHYHQTTTPDSEEDTDGGGYVGPIYPANITDSDDEDTEGSGYVRPLSTTESEEEKADGGGYQPLNPATTTEHARRGEGGGGYVRPHYPAIMTESEEEKADGGGYVAPVHPAGGGNDRQVTDRDRGEDYYDISRIIVVLLLWSAFVVVLFLLIGNYDRFLGLWKYRCVCDVAKTRGRGGAEYHHAYITRGTYVRSSDVDCVSRL